MKRILNVLFIFMLSFTIVNAKSVDFSISSVDVLEKSTSVEVDTLSFVSNKIDTSTTLKEKDDYIIYDVNVKNNDNEDYKLIRIEDNNENTNIDVSYESDKTEINSNDSINIQVKVTYSKVAKNINKKTLKDFDVILVLQDTNGDIYERIINPNTGDNIILYIVLFVLSIIGFWLIIKEKRKTGLSIFIVLLLFSPFMILGKEEYRVPIRFSNINVIGEFDVYDIVIDNGDGTTTTRSIKYGDPIGSLDEPSKEGYNFVKYVDQDGNTVTEDTIITKEISVSPVFNIINYNITYNLDGGSVSNVSTYTIEDEITLNNPTKAGYTFTGWSEGTSTNLNTNVVINRGSTGDKEFTAHYNANTNTPYVVIHKQMNLNGEYVEIERDELSGTTDSSVSPEPNDYYGFIKPSKQTVTINGDESTEVIYLYERDKFNLVVNGREYVDTNFDDGEYYYQSMITVTAKDRVGYTFSKWSDNSTDKVHVFSMDSDITIEPIYTPNQVSYKVVHKKMNVTGDGYDTYKELDLTAEADSNITVPVDTIYGFISPTEKNVKIEPNGSTVVTYLYERDKFNLTITNPQYVTPSDAEDEYYYESVVTLEAIDRVGYKFIKWTNNVITKIINLTINEDTAIGPVYSPIEYSIVFNSNGGSGSMNSMDVLYDETVELSDNSFTRTNYKFVGWNTEPDGSGTSYSNKSSVKNLTTVDGTTITLYAIWEEDTEHYFDAEESFDGSNYLNTGIELFNSDNYKRNFEISVDITSIDDSAFETSGIGGTIVNSLYETTPWPGIVFRIDNGKLELKATINNNNKTTVTFNKDEVQSIKIIRIDRIIYYCINNGDPKLLLDMNSFNAPFEDVPVTFGASMQPNNTLYEPNIRNLKDVTLSNMEVKFLPDDAEITDYGNIKVLKEVYKHEGDYTFSGDCSDLIEPTFDNGDPISLYVDETTFNKDFEISFKIGNYNYSEQPYQSTLINTKPEDGGINPGFALRFATNQNRLQLVSRGNVSGDNINLTLPANPSEVKISRKNGKLYYAVNGGGEVFAHDLSSFNQYYDLPLVIGGLKNSSGNYSRCFIGTISDVLIKVEK